MTHILDQLVMHQRFTAVEADVIRTIERALVGDPQILPIVGPARVGKTKLIAQIVRQFSAYDPNISRFVITVSSPKHLTGRALPDACLMSINMSPALFRNHVAATDAFVKAVKKHGTRLIIFDETQHMLERGSSTTVRAAADFLKGLFDQTDASILLVGLPSLVGLFQANEQLADRARTPIKYYPYHWQGEEYKCFRAALAGALQILVDNNWKTFAVNDKDFAQRMYVATAGRYGIISKIVAEVQAVYQGSLTAGYAEFFAAFQNVGMCRAVQFNPFDQAKDIELEHLALAYTSIMREAGVSP